MKKKDGKYSDEACPSEQIRAIQIKKMHYQREMLREIEVNSREFEKVEKNKGEFERNKDLLRFYKLLGQQKHRIREK